MANKKNNYSMSRSDVLELKHYRDAKAQGRLFEKPEGFRDGGAFYLVSDEGAMSEHTLVKFSIICDKLCGEYSSGSEGQLFFAEDVGRTVFANREEADKAASQIVNLEEEVS